MWRTEEGELGIGEGVSRWFGGPEVGCDFQSISPNLCVDPSLPLPAPINCPASFPSVIVRSRFVKVEKDAERGGGEIMQGDSSGGIELSEVQSND